MTQGGNYPFISVAHHFPLTSGGAAAASTVAWYQNASTGAVATSSALAGTPGTTTTGWVGPATAPTTYVGGVGPPGQVVTSMLGNSTQKWYFTQGSNESWAGHRYMKVDLLRGLPGVDVLDRYFFFVSSAADASVRHTEVEIPYFRDSGYHTLSFRIVNSSEVYTWGIMSAGVATGASTTQWSIRNPEKRNMTELETVLETNNTVLVPANYVPTGEQGRVDLLTSQTLIDLRPSIKLISNDGSRKTIGSVFIDPTGTSDALHDMAQFFLTQVPDHTDVHFPPGGRYRFTQHEAVFMSGLKDVRIFGNRSMFFYDSSVYATPPGAGSSRRDVGMFSIGTFGGTSPLKGVQNFQLHDVIMIGYPYSTEFSGGVGTAITTVAGASMTTVPGITKIGPTSGNQVRTTYWWDSRHLTQSDAVFTTDWQYRMDFRISADNAEANSVEISIQDDLGTVYAVSTITPTGAESTFTLVANTEGRDIGHRTAGFVKKLTAGASTINIHSIRRWGYNVYSGTDVETHHGIFVYSNADTTGAQSSRISNNILISGVHVEGFRGDGLSVGQQGSGAADVIIENSTFRANARQQVAVTGGERITIRNNVFREFNHTANDIEPIGDIVTNCVIEGNNYYNGLSASYNAISAPAGVVNLSIVNNNFYTAEEQFMNITVEKGFISGNAEYGYSTATGYTNPGKTNLQINSAATDVTVIGNRFTGGIYNAGTRSMFVANRIASSQSSVMFTDAGTDSVWYWNTQVGSAAFTGTFYGQVNLSSATRPTVIGMHVIGQSSAQAELTFKGTAMIGDSWHPGGMRMRYEPLRELRGISASTAKMNQLMMTVTPTANTTTMAVVFTSKPIRSVLTGYSAQTTTEAAGAALGATLTPTWTNTATFYRIAAHNYYGPASAGTTVTATLASTTSIVKINLGGLLSSRYFTNGFRIYRGEADGTTTAYYDILPTGDAKEFAALRSDLKNFYDYGTNIFIPMDNADEWGYTTAYAVITGTSVALTSCPATDYTGAMLSTTYSVIAGTPNWNAGTVYATGKTSMGFQLSWTGTTADGTNTIPLMFASS